MGRPLNAKHEPPAAERPGAKSKYRRALNVRLLVQTLIVLAVVGLGAYGWYYYQVQNTAAAMLERAGKLVEDKDDAAAAQYYFQYLKLNPRDADVRVLLAETYDRAAKNRAQKPQAVEYYYQALGVAPAEKKRGLRLRLAELLLELQRFTAAEEEAREILAKDPADREGNRLLAMALYGLSRGGSLGGGRDSALVGEVLEKARKLNPADVPLAVILADVYRNQPELVGRESQALSEEERKLLADEVIDQMVAAQPKDAQALLARHRYRLRYHQAESKPDLAEAIQANPDDLEVLLQAAAEARIAAESLRREGGPAEEVDKLFADAKKHYRRAIEISPTTEQAYLGLADLCAGTGETDAAVETLRSGLEEVGQDNFNLNALLAELLMNQGKLDEADKTITALERLAERIAPVQPQPVKLALKHAIDSLRGRWLASRGRYVEAVGTLRRVAAGPQNSAPEAARTMQARLWLGRSYAALGQWDQAAIAFEQASELSPRAVGPLVEAAAAWTAADRLDAAEQRYLQALELMPSAQVRLALARVLLLKQLRLPIESRDWGSFEKALAEAKQPDGEGPSNDAWRLKMLEADYLIARGEEPARREESAAAALALCREVEGEHPDAAGILPLLASAYERLEQPEEADRILNRLEALEDQKGQALMLKAKFLAARKQHEQARKLLADGLQSLPAEMHPALLMELSLIELSEGRADEARRHLLELRKRQPENLGLTVQLAEMSFESGESGEVEKWEQELRGLEGDDGVFWRYFRARRLLTEAAGPDDPKLVEAEELQAFVQAQRPAWSRAYLLSGMLSEARGKFDQAIEAYRGAIRLGERQPSAYRRLISLLLQANQAGEADRYLSLMHDQAAPTEAFSSLDSAVAARRGQIDRALESARLAAANRPDDIMAKLWLGQLLLSADKTAEAEEALKEAVLSAPDDPRALGALFGFYVRANRPDDAREILQRVAGNDKLDAAQRASFLAQGYESLGDREQALANYREAARLAEGEAAAQVRLAGYLLRAGQREDQSEAERLLRESLQKSPDFGPARRLLAQLLVERGGEQSWLEARQLLEEAGKDGQFTDVDRRLRAMILARRGGKENLEQAKRILEELTADPRKATDVDRRLLTRLYEAGGDVELARLQYQRLVSRENPAFSDLVAYVELLLRHERLDEADERLKILEERRPDELGTAALRALWLRGKGRNDEIEPLIEPMAEKTREGLAKDSPAEAQFLLSAGNLYTKLERHEAAERWYRRLHASRPESYPLLAGALARQGRMKEALELCVEASKSDSSALPATTAATVLLTGTPTAEDFALAEPLFSQTSKHKDDAALLSAVAGVRVVQQRLDEAVELFRRVLELNFQDLAALNNLATLLSEQAASRPEALSYIDRAIEIAGPQPGLLDTKGTILLLDGKAEDAVPLLEQAAASSLTDPRYHFHLAVAYDRSGLPEKARAAYLTARKNQLSRQILTPTDQSMLDEMRKKYD